MKVWEGRPTTKGQSAFRAPDNVFQTQSRWSRTSWTHVGGRGRYTDRHTVAWDKVVFFDGGTCRNLPSHFFFVIVWEQNV